MPFVYHNHHPLYTLACIQWWGFRDIQEYTSKYQRHILRLFHKEMKHTGLLEVVFQDLNQTIKCHKKINTIAIIYNISS